MGDRQVDIAAGVLDNTALEPAGALGRMGGDDQLVRGEAQQGTLDRDVRIGVANLSADPEAGGLELMDRSLPALVGRRQRLVHVRGPELEMRPRQGWCDDEDLGVAPPGPVAELIQQRAPADRLVGHSEDSVTPIPRSRGYLCHSRLPSAGAPQREPDPESHQRCRQDDAGSGVGKQGQRDHRARSASDDHHEPECVCLGTKRIVDLALLFRRAEEARRGYSRQASLSSNGG